MDIVRRISSSAVGHVASDASAFVKREVPKLFECICSRFPVLRCLGDRRVVAGLVILSAVFLISKRALGGKSEAVSPFLFRKMPRTQRAEIPKALKNFRASIAEFQGQLTRLVPENKYENIIESRSDELVGLNISLANKFEYFKEFVHLASEINIYLEKATHIDFSGSTVRKDFKDLAKDITTRAKDLKQHSTQTNVRFDEKAYSVPTAWVEKGREILDALSRLPMKT